MALALINKAIDQGLVSRHLDVDYDAQSVLCVLYNKDGKVIIRESRSFNPCDPSSIYDVMTQLHDAVKIKYTKVKQGHL